jgi:N-acetylmuramate 1-kinase
MIVPPRLNAPETTPAFLANAGWGRAEVAALAGDASARRYARLTQDGKTAILMLVPADHPEEALEPFIAVQSWLSQLGLSVPAIHAVDEPAGLALLEDLGDHLFPDVIAAGANETLLYHTAADVLALVHAQPCPAALPALAAPHPLPRFTADRFQAEVDRTLDWYWPAVHGGPAPEAARLAYAHAWAPLWQAVEQAPLVLTQFDFHSPNLMWLPGRSGIRRLGVLDFQDSLQGPAAYDMVSLVQDPRRDLPEGLEESCLARYLAQRPGENRAQFAFVYGILGAQRAARLLGTFARLWQRDGKPGYLKHQHRVWRHLEANLRHPDLASVKAWFDTHLPSRVRRAPWAAYQ